MSEVVFPFVGTLFVFCVVLPFSALVTKTALTALEREAVAGPLGGLHVRYVLMLASSSLPLAWLVSAGLHQAESGKTVLACLFDHHATALCFEPGLFVLALVLVSSQRALRVLLRHKPLQASRGGEYDALLARVDVLIERHAALRALRGRFCFDAASDFTLGTEGYLSPRVVVGTAFAAQLDDAALASALGHELEHMRLRDPLRYMLLDLALELNPLGRRFLEAHAARWCSAREAQCDREAVCQGCAPLPLAQAIIEAARPARKSLVALGTPDTKVLRFRIDMLMAFAERKPTRARFMQPPALSFALALLVLTVLLPHRTSTAALDVLHVGIEHTVTFLWN